MELTHAMDESCVSVTVVVIDLVMVVTCGHLLCRLCDTLNVGPLLLSIFAKGVGSTREMVE